MGWIWRLKTPRHRRSPFVGGHPGSHLYSSLWSRSVCAVLEAGSGLAYDRVSGIPVSGQEDVTFAVK